MRYVIFAFCAGILAISIAAGIAARREAIVDKEYKTYTGLLYLGIACEDYKKEKGDWPGSIADLCNFRLDLNPPGRDAWGHNVALFPYNPAVGYGRIVSYGHGVAPGGAGLNLDQEVRFPVKANYSWNKARAMQVKLPRGVVYWHINWFDSYVLRAYWPETNDLVTNADWGTD